MGGGEKSETSWEALRELKRGGKRWEELRRVENRSEKLRRGGKTRRIELRWEEIKRVENSWECLWENCEGLRRAEKSLDGTRRAAKGWGVLTTVEKGWGKARANSQKELKRLQASYGHKLHFIPMVQHALVLIIFRHPPCAGFFGTLEIHNIFLGASWFLLGLQQVEVVFHKFWSSVITLLDWRSSRFIWGCGWRSAIMARCLECSAVAKEKW